MGAEIIWVAAGIGVIAGAVMAAVIFAGMVGGWYVGNLREEPNPDEAGYYYFMEIAKGRLEHIEKAKYVLLRVQHGRNKA